MDVGQQVAGKLVFSIAYLLLSASTLKNPYVVLLLVVLGFLMGNEIDKEIAKKCPQCSAALAIVNLLI